MTVTGDEKLRVKRSCGRRYGCPCVYVRRLWDGHESGLKQKLQSCLFVLGAKGGVRGLELERSIIIINHHHHLIIINYHG